VSTTPTTRVGAFSRRIIKPIKDAFVGNEKSAIITVTAYNGKASYHLKDGRQCLYETTETESHYCSWYA